MKYEKGTFTMVPNREAMRGLDPQTQTLFMWICAYADEKGVCWPSIGRLSEDSGTSTWTVQRNIKKLVEIGILKKTKRKNSQGVDMSNMYQIQIVERVVRGAQTPTRGAQTPREGCTDSKGEGCTDSNELYPPFLTITKELPVTQKRHAGALDSRTTPLRSDPTRKALEIEKPFSLDDAIGTLYDSRQRHLVAIGIFLREKKNRFGLQIRDQSQFDLTVDRHLKAGTKLAKHIKKHDDLERGIRKALDKCEEEATLDTVIKYLTK